MRNAIEKVDSSVRRNGAEEKEEAFGRSIRRRQWVIADGLSGDLSGSP